MCMQKLSAIVNGICRVADTVQRSVHFQSFRLEAHASLVALTKTRDFLRWPRKSCRSPPSSACWFTKIASRTNVQVYQVVLKLQHLITRIPGQVERQEPVYLIVALGKISPFHLEFIRSPEVNPLTILDGIIFKFKIGSYLCPPSKFQHNWTSGWENWQRGICYSRLSY